MKSVPFYRHPLGSEDAEAIAQVLKTPMLTSGAVGKGVEASLTEFFGIEFAGLTNSWTNGALAALLALDVGADHEVIVPAMTFVATANVVELVGAKPVFIDVDPDTLLMTPDAVLAAVTPRTRAVIPVHLYGQMVNVELLRSRLRPDIAIIEDAAHCFEGTFAGDPPGHHSDVALFSFYATKNVTCGEGGAFITRHAALFEAILQTRLHGMSSGAADRVQQGRYRHWDMTRLGVKANLPDLLAALLPAQITTIRERLKLRENLAEAYEAALTPTPIRFATIAANAVSARHLFPIFVEPDRRDETIAILNNEGVGVTVNYRAVPFLTYYAERYAHAPSDFPVSRRWGEGTLSIPFYPSLSDDARNHVIQVLTDKVAPTL